MAVALALLSSMQAVDAAFPGKPNIVFILADDLGYGDVGCYNAKSKIPTPCLDRLAAQGARFTDAHAPSSLCTPSRYSILTGRYCWRSRLKRGVLGPWAPPLIPAGRLTVPELLRQHGYATACFGKWHLGMAWPTTDGKPPNSGSNHLSNVDFTKPIADGPTTHGFDYYFGTDVPNYPPFCFIENDHTLGLPSVAANTKLPVFRQPGPMLPGWNVTNILPELTRRAVRYVEDAARTNKPFFLYFPLTAPHFPIVPAPEFIGRSQAGAYGDWVAQVDWTVGQMMDALQRAGIADKTLVIFTSDNGPEITGFGVNPGAYDRARQYGHYSMGNLRGVKRDSWEGGHRVPFLARWPGKIQPGSANGEIISHIDLMATVAAMLNVKLPDNAGEDSFNILAALCGEKLSHPVREAVVHSATGKYGIRKGDWVFIDAPSGDNNDKARGEPAWFKQERGYGPDDQPGELFDLREDLSERRNHYADKPETVRELKELLEKYKRDGRSTPGPAQQNDDAIKPTVETE